MRYSAIAILAVGALAFTADPASAKTFPIKFVSRAGMAAVCKQVGGQSFGSPTGYGCSKKCAGEKWCHASCYKGKCEGQTPTRVSGAQDVTGVLTASPGLATAPAKPGGIPGTGILDNGLGFSSQGPAATGSPVSAPSAPSAPPLIIR
jgi:hypothetical protein